MCVCVCVFVCVCVYCVLSYKVYYAYSPSNGAMVLLNKISVFRTFRILSLSQGQVEDEFHFICMCPLYKRLRAKYIDPDMRKKNTFTRLFSCNS